MIWVSLAAAAFVKKKSLARQMLWIDEQCFYTVNGKHSVYLHSDTVMLYPFHMSHVHKSVKSCVFFKHYVQKWVVNYRASREGDSAVLQAYGKTDWGWIIDASHFCLPVDACQWGMLATNSVSVYFEYKVSILF